MGDFISSTGTNVLYGKKKYGVKQEDILDQIKKTLKKKILSERKETDELEYPTSLLNNEKYLELIQPISFLKSYNLTPPLCE